MSRFLNLVAMGVIFGVTALMWLGFAALMLARTEQQESSLQSDVAELWGQEMVQQAPEVTWPSKVRRMRSEPVYGPDGMPRYDSNGVGLTTLEEVWEDVAVPVPLTSTHLDVDLRHDPRRKGLIWFSLYDVALDGTWTATFTGDAPGRLRIAFPFPQMDGIYDDFVFEVNGQPVETAPANSYATTEVDAVPGEVVTFRVRYRSRGRDSWVYRPVNGWQTGEVRDFTLAMHTDFADIDFPGRTMSPSTRERTGSGWTLDWAFERLVTGQGIGMITPSRVQAGTLAAQLSFTAPISLALFMTWVAILALMRGVSIHPVNFAFVAGAFFSFHLLFGYTADHLPVEWAFALSSAVSVFLTVSYLRLVAGPRFALVQAGGAQLVYQVGFSAAHFFDGLTGLTLTVLLIGTLFALMQLTGRVRWEAVFAGQPQPPSPEPNG